MKLENNFCVFSPDRVYRYELWRVWGDGDKYVQFIGLNPSTADETQDDPTVRRCIQFAKDWGFDAMCMTNLFALRSTDPKVLRHLTRGYNCENELAWINAARKAELVVACWGNHGSQSWISEGLRYYPSIKGMKCFGLTKTGQPKHPLYLSKKSALQSFN